MNLKVVRILQSVVSSRLRPVSKWSPAVLNSTCCVRFGTTPYQMMMRRAPQTVLPVLVGKAAAGWTLEEDLFEAKMQELVASMVKSQYELRRQGVHMPTDTGTLPSFSEGDYFWWRIVSWTETWRVVSWGTRHMYTVQDIVTSETQELRAARVRTYPDLLLVVGHDVREVLEVMANT